MNYLNPERGRQYWLNHYSHPDCCRCHKEFWFYQELKLCRKCYELLMERAQRHHENLDYLESTLTRKAREVVIDLGSYQ